MTGLTLLNPASGELGGKQLTFRRWVAASAWLVGGFLLQEPLWRWGITDTALQASALMVSYGFFVSLLQANWAFYTGLLSILIPLGALWAGLALPGISGWVDAVATVFTIVFVGLAALGGGQRTIWQ